MKDFLNLESLLIDEYVLILSTTIKLLVNFKSKHENDISEATLPELFGWDTVKFDHGSDIVLIRWRLSGLKL